MPIHFCNAFQQHSATASPGSFVRQGARMDMEMQEQTKQMFATATTPPPTAKYENYSDKTTTRNLMLLYNDNG